MSVISFEQEAPPCVLLISKDCQGCRNLLSITLYTYYFEKLAQRLGIPRMTPTMLEDQGIAAQNFLAQAGKRLEHMVEALRQYLTCVQYCIDPSEIHLIEDDNLKRQVSELVREAEEIARHIKAPSEEEEEEEESSKKKRSRVRKDEERIKQDVKNYVANALFLLNTLDADEYEEKIQELREVLRELALLLHQAELDHVVDACAQVVFKKTGVYVALKTRQITRYLDDLARLLNQIRNAERWYKLWLNARKVIVNPYTLDYKVYYYDTPALVCLDHVEPIEAPSQPAFRLKEKRGASYDELAAVRIQLRLLAEILVDQVVKYRYRRGLKRLGIAQELSASDIEHMFEKLRSAARRLGLETEDFEIAENPRLMRQLSKIRKEEQKLKRVMQRLMSQEET